MNYRTKPGQLCKSFSQLVLLFLSAIAVISVRPAIGSENQKSVGAAYFPITDEPISQAIMVSQYGDSIIVPDKQIELGVGSTVKLSFGEKGNKVKYVGIVEKKYHSGVAWVRIKTLENQPIETYFKNIDQTRSTSENFDKPITLANSEKLTLGEYVDNNAKYLNTDVYFYRSKDGKFLIEKKKREQDNPTPNLSQNIKNGLPVMSKDLVLGVTVNNSNGAVEFVEIGSLVDTIRNKWARFEYFRHDVSPYIEIVKYIDDFYITVYEEGSDFMKHYDIYVHSLLAYPFGRIELSTSANERRTFTVDDSIEADVKLSINTDLFSPNQKFIYVDELGRKVVANNTATDLISDLKKELVSKFGHLIETKSDNEYFNSSLKAQIKGFLVNLTYSVKRKDGKKQIYRNTARIREVESLVKIRIEPFRLKI